MRTRKVQIAEPAVGADEWQALREPLESGWLTQGPKVAEFERAFAARHDVRHAVATTSCTTALHLALVALGLGPGDEVLVPAFTWVATANVVVYCGATPIFVDVDPVTFNIDPACAASRVSEATRAVIAVHLFGLPADVEGLRGALPEHVILIEDAACAAGGRLNGVSVGALGRVAAFSFHPRKSITTGEGGMLTTNDDTLAERAIMLRNHGASVPEEQRHRGSRPFLLPEFNLLGFNYRMTDLQGAVGAVQLGKLDRFVAERQRGADFYREELASMSWLRAPVNPNGDSQHAWQSYVTRIDAERAPLSRNGIMKRLQVAGVSTRPGTHAVHALGYYRAYFGTRPDDCPIAWDCEQSTLALPLHNRMSADDYRYVVESLRSL